MLHYRVLGVIWLVGGTILAYLFYVEKWQGMGHQVARIDLVIDWYRVLIGAILGFFCLCAVAGYGLFRARTWARYLSAALSIVLLLHFSHALSQAEVRAQWETIDWLVSSVAVTIALYTVAVAIRIRVHTDLEPASPWNPARVFITFMFLFLIGLFLITSLFTPGFWNTGWADFFNPLRGGPRANRPFSSNSRCYYFSGTSFVLRLCRSSSGHSTRLNTRSSYGLLQASSRLTLLFSSVFRGAGWAG